MGKYMSYNNNYFTPDDDDEDYGFIDFEDDYTADDTNYNNNTEDNYEDEYEDSEPVDLSKDYKSSKGVASYIFSEISNGVV